MSTTTRQKELFLAARDLADGGERARFLADACGADTALRARVEQMLAADAASDHFLEAPITPPPELPGPVSGDTIGYFGDYVLLDEIARGASGVVFRARQVSLDRVVALKMLRDRGHFATEADTRRLRAEAAAAAALDHPHIVPIHEVGVHEGQPYFSMKLIEGGTLQWRMAEYQADARMAAALMAVVARAVHHAHTRGVLHRDLKPGNILVDRAGAPHITDFGLARKIGEISQLSITGQIVGTPHYMAPEQMRGAGRELTPGADIYSMGAMLYELLEARHAFAADDLLELFRQVTESPPPPLRRAPADLAAIVLQCLAKQPAHRYGTAAALADDLDRWLRGEPVQAMRHHRLRSALFLLRRHRWKVAAAAVITAGGAFFWFNTGPDKMPPPPVITITTLTDELETPGTGLSLREALRDAPDGARLIIAPTLRTRDAKLTLDATLGGMEIQRSVTLDGAGLTIQSGEHTDRIFVIAGEAHASFHNLTLSGGVQSETRRGSVGGIESNGTLSMTDCRVVNNGGAGFGGGISSNGDVFLLRCVFSGNVSNGVGGALCVRGPFSKLRAEHCVFTGNVSYGNGGGAICITIKSRDAQVQLTHCTITGNTCTASPTRLERPRRGSEAGGGIRIQSGNLVLSRCIIAGNDSTVPGTENISGTYTESGPNFIGGDPAAAPAGLGAQIP